MIHTEYLCPNLAQAMQNRARIANHEATNGYREQELMRERWLFGEAVPDMLVTGDLPQVHQKHYHPFVEYRYTDE